MGLDEYLAIIDSRSESCVRVSCFQEVYILFTLINIKNIDQWLRLTDQQCKVSKKTKRLYFAYQAQMPNAVDVMLGNILGRAMSVL